MTVQSNNNMTVLNSRPTALQTPERAHQIMSENKRITIMTNKEIKFELAKIEWNSPGEYHRFMGVIKKEKACWESEVHGFLDYARHLDSWDYNTCLAYIIYIQRSDYASGGFTHIFGDMAANGTIKKDLMEVYA